MASETRRSSWRATHQTRPAVARTTSRATTRSAASVLTARRSKVTERSPAVAAFRGEGGAAGLQPGDRHPERRAGHVVEADVVEEVHRRGVAAVLAADPEVQV